MSNIMKISLLLCHVTLSMLLLHHAQKITALPSPGHVSNAITLPLPSEGNSISHSRFDLSARRLKSRSLTFSLGDNADWVLIIDSLFPFLEMQNSATTFGDFYRQIANIATATYHSSTPFPVLLFNFRQLALEFSAPTPFSFPIPHDWLYQFAVQMLPIVERGGLTGEYRARLVNTRTGVTILARLAVRGAERMGLPW